MVVIDGLCVDCDVIDWNSASAVLRLLMPDDDTIVKELSLVTLMLCSEALPFATLTFCSPPVKDTETRSKADDDVTHCSV